MIDGLTAEEYNAREHRRGSIVAKLHGYTPFDAGDTQESLKAEHLAITGEPYKTEIEEQAAKVEKAAEARTQRIAHRKFNQEQAVGKARLKGFQNCHEIFEALGFKSLTTSGTRRNHFQVATHWINQAGYVSHTCGIPVGAALIDQSDYTGCFQDDVTEIVRYCYAWYASLQRNEWDIAMEDARNYQSIYGNTENMNWTEYIATLGARPEVDEDALDEAEDRRDALKIEDDNEDEADQETQTEREEFIREKMRSYEGPMTPNGYPPRRFLKRHVGYVVPGNLKRQLWDEVQSETRNPHDGALSGAFDSPAGIEGENGTLS